MTCRGRSNIFAGRDQLYRNMQRAAQHGRKEHRGQWLAASRADTPSSPAAGAVSARPIAEALAGAGARLTVMGRSRDALEAEAEKLRRNAPAHAVEVDVAEPTSVQRAFARAEQEFGPATILINNAGQAASAPFQKPTWRCGSVCST